MADTSIDQDETQVYGPYATKNIRTRLIGRLAAFDQALEYAADQIDICTIAVKSNVDAARAKDAQRRQGTENKGSLLKNALRLLGRFSKHLDTHAPGTVDRKVFFIHDGTAGGVGQGAHNVLIAVSNITTQLADPKSTIREANHWHGEFDTAMKALAPAIAFADDTRGDRQSLTPEVEAARLAWLQAYQAAKCVVEGVLRYLGRTHQLSLFFYDLRVSPNTKVTEAPPDEPAEAPEQDTKTEP